MNSEKINLLRDFVKWARTTASKSANLSISIWQHSSDDKESTEYCVWVNDLINKRSEDLDALIGMIPKFKQLIELNMEVAA